MRKYPRAAPETTRQGVFKRKTGSTLTLVDPAALAVSYRRVSTGHQDAENQLADVERLARARGLILSRDYVETVSAQARKRPAFEAMLEDARRGAFRVLVVWALDRVGRSLFRNLAAIVELDRLGVQVISVREPWLDTSGPIRNLLIAIFSWVAEHERESISRRTLAGLERARARGRRLGRPRRMLTNAELARARELLAEGVPLRVIAQRVQMPRATLHRVLGLVPKRGTDSEGSNPRVKRGARRVSRKRTIGGR